MQNVRLEALSLCPGQIVDVLSKDGGERLAIVVQADRLMLGFCTTDSLAIEYPESDTEIRPRPGISGIASLARASFAHAGSAWMESEVFIQALKEDNDVLTLVELYADLLNDYGSSLDPEAIFLRLIVDALLNIHVNHFPSALENEDALTAFVDDVSSRPLLLNFLSVVMPRNGESISRLQAHLQARLERLSA